MNEPLVFSALALASAAIAWPLARRRLELSLAKHPSLTGHSRMAKRVARLLPGYAYDETRFFASDDAPAEVVYGLAHPLEVVPGGLLASIVGSAHIDVNSVHGQGVNRLAQGLRVEARAPDGLVEAFSMPDAQAFNLCVQWHPEWQAASNPVSVQLFKAFGAACKSFSEQRFRDRHKEPHRDPDR